MKTPPDVYLLSYLSQTSKLQSKLSLFTASAGHIARSMMRRGVGAAQNLAHAKPRSAGGAGSKTAQTDDADPNNSSATAGGIIKEQGDGDSGAAASTDLLGALLRKQGTAPGNHAQIPGSNRTSQSRTATVDNVVAAGMRSLRHTLSMGVGAPSSAAASQSGLSGHGAAAPSSAGILGSPGWRTGSMGNVSEGPPSRFLSRTDSNTSRRASSMGGAATLPASPVDFLDGLVSFGAHAGGAQSDGGGASSVPVASGLPPRAPRTSRPTWEDLYSRVRSARQTGEDGAMRQLPRFVYTAELPPSSSNGAAADAAGIPGGLTGGSSIGGATARGGMDPIQEAGTQPLPGAQQLQQSNTRAASSSGDANSIAWSGGMSLGLGAAVGGPPNSQQAGIASSAMSGRQPSTGAGRNLSEQRGAVNGDMPAINEAEL